MKALERELGRDLRALRDERVVRGLHDDELEPEAFRVGEGQAALGPCHLSALGAEPCLPEVQSLLRGDAPDDAVHHAVAGLAAPRSRVLEECDVGAG